MDAPHILLFMLAVMLITSGHLLRAMRWGLLLNRPHRHELRIRFTALAVGYVVNAIVPLRIGELVRGLFFAMQTQSKFTLSFASIVVERAYDLVAITCILLVCGTLSMPYAPALALATGGLAAIVFAVIYAIDRFAWARKIVWRVANMFNARIRFVVLDTAMALVEIEQSARTLRMRFMAQTLAMWTAYIASYIVIGLAVGLNFSTVLNFFYGDVFKPTIIDIWHKTPSTALVVTLYALTPCVLILVYAQLKRMAPFRIDAALWWLTDPLTRLSRRSNDRFGETSQYEAFLCRHFSGDASTALDFEIHSLQDAAVIRRLTGGSEAIIAVVQVGAHMRLRKFAINGAARKLEAQYLWLQRYHDRLPVVSVMEAHSMDERVYYDMPYSISSRDFYDFIHLDEPESAWPLLSDILTTMQQFHANTRTATADETIVRQYATKKVVENFALIRRAFPQIFAGETLKVNGRTIDLRLLHRFASEDYLMPRLTLRDTAVIHGDLTIENIIYDPAVERQWFLIDPNIGNIFESPLLDFAKIFQSLHLGYEGLNRNNPCSYSEYGIEFQPQRTQAYEFLFAQTSEWVRRTFGEQAYREIRLHEIIHYFRLIPYKIHKSPQAGLLFFGCLCLLIERYHEECES